MTDVRHNLDLYVGDLSFNGAPTASNVVPFFFVTSVSDFRIRTRNKFPPKRHYVPGCMAGLVGLPLSAEYRENLRPPLSNDL